MKEQKKGSMILGVLIGLVMPVVGVALVFWARPELQTLQEFEHEIVRQINTELITVGIIINAALFFVFLRFDRENTSRGILAASGLCLILVFIYRLLL